MSGPVVVSQYDSSGSYHASVMVSLDSHQIHTTSTSNSQANPLHTMFNLDKNLKVSVINWLEINDMKYIGLGLTNGSIIIYSPLTNAIITTISTLKNSLITSVQYSAITKSIWGSDNTGTIYEWDIYYNPMTNFSINDFIEINEMVNSLLIITIDNIPHILIGSHSIYLVNIKTQQLIKTFPAHIQPIKSIIAINDDYFLSSAQGDRFINLYSIEKSIKTVFVTESPVLSIEISKSGNITTDDDDSLCLIARTENKLEIFNGILSEDSAITTSSKKKRRQQLNNKSRSCNGSVNLVKHHDDIKGTTSATIDIMTIKNVNNLIFYSWLENVTNFRFDTIELPINDHVELIKKKLDTHNPNNLIKGHDISAIAHYNEGNTIITDGYNLNHVEDDDDDNETLLEKLEKLNTDIKSVTTKKNGMAKPVNHTPTDNHGKSKKISNNTLTTILSQSLKNNDMALLETVLGNKDQQIIQNTIIRLDSSLAIILLDKISEKLSRQANKFDQLIYWIKWILIIHGSVIASINNFNIKLSNLHSLLTKKSEILPKLMNLKSKMEVMYENNEINQDLSHNVDDDDSDVEYIEELDNSDIELEAMMDNVRAGDSDDDYDHDDHDAMDMDGEVDEDSEDDDEEEIGMVTNDYVESD